MAASAALLLAGHAGGANAFEACSAADVSAQVPGCPAGAGPCTITGTVQLSGADCVLDFGDRDVLVGAPGAGGLIKGSVAAHGLTLRARSLTLGPNGGIEILRDSAACDLGGCYDEEDTANCEAYVDIPRTVKVEVTGDVTVERGTSTTGRIDLRGRCFGGGLEIDAGGTVKVDGLLDVGNMRYFSLEGGVISIEATAIHITAPGDVRSSEGTGAYGGSVVLRAGQMIDVDGRVDLSGGEGGELEVEAPQVRISGTVDLTGGTQGAGVDGEPNYGDGGVFYAYGGLELLGVVNTGVDCRSYNSLCGGGYVVVQATPIVIAGTLSAGGSSAAGTDFWGGYVALESRDTITVTETGLVSTAYLSPFAVAAYSGDIHLYSDRGGALVQGVLDASSSILGGGVYLTGAGTLRVEGAIRARGHGREGRGGYVDLTSGEPGRPGRVEIAGSIDVSADGVATPQTCEFYEACAEGGTVEIQTCDLVVAAEAPQTAGRILALGDGGGGGVRITARRAVQVDGVIDARPRSGQGKAGKVTIDTTVPAAPVAGAIDPAPQWTTYPACDITHQKGCMTPCTVCGDGVMEFPETCDTPGFPPVNCDGCSRECQLENCDDGWACSIDTCEPNQHPFYMCRHTPEPLPCNPPPTYCKGDCDKDGVVDADDLDAMVYSIAMLRGLSCRDAGDLDHDGKVTAADLTEVVASIADASSCPTAAAP